MAKEPNLYLLSDKAQKILDFVRTHEDELTSNEISDTIGTDIVSHRGAVGVINSLVKRGLVTRELRTDENGNTIKVVLPTEDGKKFDLKTPNPKHDEWLKKEAEKATKEAAKDEEPLGSDDEIAF